MKQKSKNLITLRDFVNEQFLLEQVSSLYDCPPGYGHNPFTGTCYPIPNKIDAISGLEGPKVVRSQGDTEAVDEPGPDPTNKDEVKALAVKMRPFWDNPLDGTAECFKNYPISSFVGTILGASSSQQGFIRTGLKVTVTPARALWATAGKLWDASGRLAIASLALFAIGAFKPFEDNVDTTETVDFLTSTINKGKAFLNSEWTDWTYAGAACAANLLAATYFLAKGAKFIGKQALKDLATKKDFLDETSKLLGRSTVKVLGEKPTHATLWIALKQRNLLPKGKEVIELSKEGILTIPKGEIITVPTSRLSKKNLDLFKDFIEGDKVVLNLDKAAEEFQKASSEIIHVTAEIYHKQAKNVLKNSKMIEDFQKLVGIIGKDGKVSRKKLVNQYLKETANVLEQFTKESKPQIKKLYNDGLKLKRTEPAFIGEAELKKTRELVARGDNPSSVVADLKISPEQKKALEEYLTLYKNFSKLEQEMASKFASIKSFMEQEANFSKLYGKNVDLRAALTSNADVIEQKRINTAIGLLKQFSKEMREAVVGTNIRSSLTNTIEELTFITLATGAAYTGAVLVPKWRNELSLPYIYEAAESFFAQKGDDYLKSLQKPRSTEINLEKLFNDFAKYYESTVQPGPNTDPVSSVELVKEFSNIAPKSQDVKKHLSGKNVLTIKRLKQNFLTLISGQFGGDPNVKPKTKKDGVITPASPTANNKRATTIIDQIPEGEELVDKEAFPVNVGGQQISVKFTKDYFELNGRQFEFRSGTGWASVGAKIDSVRREKNIIKTELSAFGTVQKNELSEKDLQNIFRKAIGMKKVDDSVEVSLGGDEGAIKRLKENKEVNKMSKKDIRQLVAEVLNEGYGKYPYNANEPSEGEPDEDYMVEWKALVDEVCDNKKKNVDGDPNTFDDATIEVAKILVKDQDLFRDVLEMAGSNKSIGVEILQQLKAVREKSLDKEKNV